ncbi:YbaB/EbfC family nucleoid-associated protein [Micromonospora sp. WMMD1102]|uniref:YbaB/EbfC family nucleoid-associated protein n=1 Tax=Micromonospora sp. WMMD1102 TaxID=3016105 RepID=UPI002414E947|nr:YbaB/EbfC family nucleoid-associated protein [Micromonospora sp. WMMD1102]MDG4789347.1 YbaB/EbfC family nucleoid-associated protein [Micromonospora sp. WMMD1102]
MSDLWHVLGDIDRLMEAVQREADAARDRQQPNREASGSALDGRVRVRLAADGQVAEIRLDDEVTGIRPAELAEGLTRAFNQAWQTARDHDDALLAAGAVDPAVLAEQLREVREQSMRSMRAITDSLTDAMARIERRAG